MEPQITSMPVFCLQPPLRSALIAFAPEEHEYGKNIDGGDAPHASIKIDESYTAKSASEAKRLRKHIGNAANGGDTFFEVSSEVMRHGRALEGISPASMPEGGLNDEDKLRVNALTKASLEAIPPPSAPGLVEKMKWAVERFRVADFQVPDENRKIPIIKGRLVELMELLEEHGIKAEEK